MNNKLKIILTLLLVVVIFPLFSKSSSAQSASAQCLGSALAEYMNTVVETTETECGGLDDVRLLSPAFNMTNNFAIPIINAATTAGANWGSLYGVSGNAYECCGSSVLGHVQRFMSGTSVFDGMPVYLTETGFITGSQQSLRDSISQINSGSAGGFTFIGASFFAPFEGLGGGEWASFQLGDEQIRYYCGGSCSERIGFNSATYFPNVGGEYYERAENLGMRTTVSIANLDDGNLDSIVSARNRGFAPVVRIGHGGLSDDAGLTAAEYGRFLCELDSRVNETVYAIAGPNEPQTEHWFAPACQVDTVDLGDDRRPLEQGFSVMEYYPCEQSIISPWSDLANPEFHTLRPYPGSPCDPLIPRSTPEAPESEEPGSWDKYLNYACGTSLDFSTIGSFNPYGLADTSETVTNVHGDEFLLTVCAPRTNLNDYETITCYRTVKFNISMSFEDAKVGILGNTQLTNLTPPQKVNNYLSWYWTGIPQIGDHHLYDIDDEFTWRSSSPQDNDQVPSRFDLNNLGIFTNGGGNAAEYISTVNPNMVVLYSTGTDFSYANNIPSDTMVVGRSGGVFPDNLPTNPPDVSSQLTQLMRENPSIDVWQGYNEPLYHLNNQGITNSTDQFNWLLSHDLSVIQSGQNEGRDVCIGNFKEGWPTDSQLSTVAFTNYANQIVSAASSSDINVYLCVHEHEDATSNSGTWTFSNRYNGRFTRIVSAGLDLPVLVTVAGFDSEAGSSDAGDGWQSAGISPENYARMLLDYRSAALANGAVGVAVFQVGLGGQWEDFDISPLLELTQQQDPGDENDPESDGMTTMTYADMIVNYSGPIRKLVPHDAQLDIRAAIADSLNEEVHNHLVEDADNGPEDGVQGRGFQTRLAGLDNPFTEALAFRRYWPNVPLSSLEDVAGEVFFTSFGAGVGARSDPSDEDPDAQTTAPFQFNITCAIFAGGNCP